MCADDSLLLTASKTLSRGRGVITVAVDECSALSDHGRRRYFLLIKVPCHSPHLTLAGSGPTHRNSGPSVQSSRGLLSQLLDVVRTSA